MKDRIISILFVLILVGLMVYSFILPDKEVSVSERRKLQQLPEFKIASLFDGNYFSELNDYFVEQFPFRDEFRNLKGIFSFKIFRKYDNNGVFVKDNSIYKLNSEINYKSVNHMIGLVNKIIDNNILSDRIYYSIVPDKNYYLDDKNIPKIDYLEFEEMITLGIDQGEYISLFDCLDGESYYKTDIHYRQERLDRVVNKFRREMNLYEDNDKLFEYEYDKFYGALYGQVASNIEPDKLIYLSNDTIDRAIVYDYEEDKYMNVYEKENLNNIDSYDIYLGGAKALLVIENKLQDNGKELVIFRDSFGSSLVPLLIENYEIITMIDLRYLSSSMLDKIDKIEFNQEQDILFLYSVPIINDSFTLK